MKHALTQMLSGRDNVTLDFIRVSVMASIAIGLGLQVASFITGKPFDMQAYGVGLGIMFASAGAALKIKESTEPGSTPGVTATSTSTSTITETAPS